MSIIKRSLVVTCVLIAMLVCAGTIPAVATTLWYNGDLGPPPGGLANEIYLNRYAKIYEDFNVPSGGWTIDTVWSNDLMKTSASQAHWEIRSGVSPGDGGTLIASGTDPASQTATGRSYSGYTEYTIQVTGLNVNLGPGTYWLSVTPIVSITGQTFLSNTSGANAIGQPPGNNGNSFIDSDYFNHSFDPTSSIWGTNKDYSMGVAFNAVPLPPSLLLLGSGLLGLGAVGWRKRRQG